jgi:hypothetical protein
VAAVILVGSFKFAKSVQDKVAESQVIAGTMVELVLLRHSMNGTKSML